MDLYFSTKLHASDPVMNTVLNANAEAGLPAIDVSPNQGKLLYLLAKTKDCRNILVIGTLGDIAVFGWPVPCRKMDNSSHLNLIPSTQRWLKRT